MRTKPLTDCKWITAKQQTNEYAFWLVIELIDTEEIYGSDNEGKPKYVAQVHAVSPDLAGPENIADAIECYGVAENLSGELAVVECLFAYGVSAICDEFSGNNRRKVLRAAKHAIGPIAAMLGFFLDGPQNQAGHTGWDFLKGDLSSETAIANRKRWGSEVPPVMHVES